MAREISLADIKEIRDHVTIELETFIHGAMCISYSGRCLLSNYFTGTRDANRGECTQVCRWKFSVVEEKRPGQYFPVMEDDRGSYIFNSKDLCLLPHIPRLAAAGINSFKIEGRMKSAHYVATVVKVYRQAIDAWQANPDKYSVRPEWWEELEKISHRPYTTGFYFGKPSEADQIYSGKSNVQTHDFVGLVRSYDKERKVAVLEQRNNFKVGDEVEFCQPDPKMPNFSQVISSMADSDGNTIVVAPHAQQLVTIPMNHPVASFAMMRRKVNPSD